MSVLHPNLIAYPNTKLLRYPHMFPRDISIWERFLAVHSFEYNAFYYDVKVGKGSKPKKSTIPPYTYMQVELSKFRIDVIGDRGDHYELFEAKPNASASAIGQVLVYTLLFKKEYGYDLPVTGAIVTDYEKPDMRLLTEELGMNYYVV